MIRPLDTKGLSVATQPLVNTNNICYVNSCVVVLTYVSKYGIIHVVGCLPTKGGCCDNDGEIFNSRGGSNRTEYDSLLCQGIVAQRRDARTQDWLKVAHRPGRICGVEKAEAESVQRTVSGKLNSSSVARCDLVTIGTRHQAAVSPRYLIAIIPCPTKQVNGNGVAVRRDSL